MKRSFMDMVLKAHALHAKGLGYPEIAKKLKIEFREEVMGFVRAGERINIAESCRLSNDELKVMRALVNAEVRAIETDTWPPKTSSVDLAAGMRGGWCVRVIGKRLRMAHDGEPGPHGQRLNFIFHTPMKGHGSAAGRVYLTAAGWAFVWDVGLLNIKNWKEPRDA